MEFNIYGPEIVLCHTVFGGAIMHSKKNNIFEVSLRTCSAWKASNWFVLLSREDDKSIVMVCVSVC